MINAYTSWQPLEEVIVGRSYPPEYFDYIKDSQVRAQLQQILAETEEDLNQLQRTIETYGARVYRPDIIEREWFERSQIPDHPFFEGRRHNHIQTVPLPPLTPRDWQITLGNKLLRITPQREVDGICAQYRDQVVSPSNIEWAGEKIYDPASPLNGANASCIVRVGRDVFFDNSDYLRPEHTRWIVDNVLGPEYRIHEARTDGHGDAVFAILKPGVILSSKHDVNLDLAKDFPGWEVLKIMDSSIDAAMSVGRFKQENFNDRWYVQGQVPTPEFRSYVDQYLSTWVGYVKETVFDVNCLVLDESNVIFSAYNKTVFDFCERHQINPIISELRHSYFWDGGISCCTQDLSRQGGLETYL